MIECRHSYRGTAPVASVHRSQVFRQARCYRERTFALTSRKSSVSPRIASEPNRGGLFNVRVWETTGRRPDEAMVRP